MAEMKKKLALLSAVAVCIIIIFAIWLWFPPRVPETAIPNSTDAVAHGQYLVYAGGCISCHTGTEDDKSLSGGLALATDFGTFYVPNITPDTDTGIGNWSGRDFLLALKHGRRSDGGFYFPAFPYRSYAGLTDTDVLDIGAWLMAQPAVKHAVPEHELPAWLSRWMMASWNLLADLLQTTPPAESDPVIARGGYLVRHLGHCGECHTPRNHLGILDPERELAGALMGEHKIEAINGTALAGWSREDINMLLLLGIRPDGDFVGGDMAKVVEDNTSHLTDADRQAISAYLKR